MDTSTPDGNSRGSQRSVAGALRDDFGAAWYRDFENGRAVHSVEWLAMLGHAEHEVGDGIDEWRSRIHPDERARALALVRAALVPGAPAYADEYRMSHRDGTWRRVQSRGQVVERDALGNGLRMVGVDREIGAEGRLEESLRQPDAIIALAERVVGLAWWTWNMQTDATSWSPGMFKSFGLDPSLPEPTFADQRSLFSPESYQRLVKASRNAVATGGSYLMEAEIVQPGGARRSVIGSGEVVRDVEGRPIGMRGVMSDITELLLLKRGVREQAQLLSQVSRIGRIGGWSLDLVGNVLSWTDETYRIHELEPGEPIDVQRATAFYHPDFRPLFVAELRRFGVFGPAAPDAAPRPAGESDEGFDLEARLVTARGRTIWVRSCGQAERAGDRIVRLSGTFQDITAAKEAQARLAQAMEDLRVRNRELQDFAVAASHDLQEPLRKIQTLGSLLAERFAGGLDAQGIDLLERMRAAAGRMGDLVGDLLAYSRVGRHEPLAEIDLGEVAAGVVADLEVEILTCGGVVSVGRLPRLRADATQLRQVLQNLIGNALKYQPPGRPPRVQVEAGVLDLPAVVTGEVRAHCRLQVSDNGIGFEPRYAEQIFAPFQRLHDRSRYSGTGMGLAIVRRIAERHGGRVYAGSTPGQGSLFTLELPLDGPPPAPDEAPAA